MLEGKVFLTACVTTAQAPEGFPPNATSIHSTVGAGQSDWT
jgi:hypothetical protein